jgi:hypothetical protein
MRYGSEDFHWRERSDDCSRDSLTAVKGARVWLGEERYLLRETDCGWAGPTSLSVCYSFANGTNLLDILLGITEQR